MKDSNIVVVLNDIRSNENVGSIFRTSDAGGVSKIFLVGYTPAPLDRFDRVNKALAKVALGAEKDIAYQKFENLAEAIQELEKQDFKIVAVEQDEKSIDYRGISQKLLVTCNKLALVFGNEVTGLSKEDLALCDLIAEIPMRDSMVRQAHHPRYSKRGKESLNVAVSAGIVLFSLIK